MGACGGPLDLAGYESRLVSVSEFQSSCVELVEALHSELGDCSTDTDIGVDDLKILSVEELIERGIRASPEADDESRRKKRKTYSDGGRPCDRYVRATELQVNASLLRQLIEERKLERENALSKLHSLRWIEEVIEKEKKIATKRLRSAGPLKFVTSTLESPKPLASASDDQTVSPDEVVISIDVHNRRNIKFQEFVVLGSQPLTALKDQLYCLTDQLAAQKEMRVPSAYFLIENVFYNDLRDPEAVDYSEPIRRWIDGVQQRRDLSRRKPVKIPSFTTASMAETCFKDLAFKVGSRYLYCHQGDCKHVIVFRDVRLIHRDDNQLQAAYPLLRFLPRLRYRKCSICSVYRARKVTYDDKLAPSNPCFFCESCYYSLHYSSDGIILYEDFREHDYYHE